MLIAGRLLQAAGGGGGVGLARAIARDVFGADRLVKVLAYLTMAYAIGPMISAPLGGALVDWAGWRAVLIAATISGIIIVGALIATGSDTVVLTESGNSDTINSSRILGFIAVMLASVNIFGGFIVTQRMLRMFKNK